MAMKMLGTNFGWGTIFMRWQKLLVMAVTVAALGACGGGGGGNAAIDVPLLRLTNIVLPAVDQEVFEGGGDPIPTLSIAADVVGNLQSLNGATVYVIVQDPDALFDSKAGVSLSANGLGNVLTIYGRSVNAKAGTFHGPLTVNVCLDPACLKPLGGSPFSVPYTIKVLQGLQLTQNLSTLTAAFDSPSAPWTTSVLLPTGATDFTAQVTTKGSSGPHYYGQQMVTLSRNDTALTLTGVPCPALTFYGDFEVNATGVTSKGRLVPLQLIQRFEYQVGAGMAFTFVYQPLSASLTAGAGTSSYAAAVTVVSKASNGDIYDTIDHVDYLPPGPSGNLDANGFAWLRFLALGASSTGVGYDGAFTVSAVACNDSWPVNAQQTCLAPGRYEALIYPKSTYGTGGNGGNPVQPFPVDFTVSP
jgi:hypothetical protein